MKAGNKKAQIDPKLSEALLSAGDERQHESVYQQIITIQKIGGSDGTRTRDLLRDRQAF
jgi:hypothetical protein